MWVDAGKRGRVRGLPVGWVGTVPCCALVSPSGQYLTWASEYRVIRRTRLALDPGRMGRQEGCLPCDLKNSEASREGDC